MAMECQKSNFEIQRVFVSETYQDEIPASKEPPITVSPSVFSALSDEKTPQGIACVVKIPQRPLCPPTGKCLFLDGVADPGNMGAIIRSANAAGYNEIYLSKECTDPYSPKSVRASMSGIFFTTLYIAEREEILSMFKAGNVPLIVADMGGENIFQFTAPKQFALAIGNEGNGISKATKEQADYTVRIPMSKQQESLNAAVSAGIAMYVLSKDEFLK